VNELPTGEQLRFLQLYIGLAKELKRPPSERELAAAHGTEKNNARHYLRQLEAKGFLAPIHEQRVIGYEVTEAGRKWAKVQL
jgi:predicted transcriptional regulator